jgi:hypothetical protein
VKDSDKKIADAKRRAEKTAAAIQKRKKAGKPVDVDEPAGLLSNGWDKVALARTIREQKQEKE